MYICCKHCRHTGHHIHERGHRCNKHETFIDYNDKESAKLMFECKKCQLAIDDLLSIARYMKTISFEYVFDEGFESRNDMGAYLKDSEVKNGFYKDPVKAFHVHDVDTTEHIIGYRVLFNRFPVYYTENIEEIKLIKKGLGLKE